MKAEISIESNAAEIKAAKDAAIERALEAIGLQAEGNVAMLAPVDTGRLRGPVHCRGLPQGVRVALSFYLLSKMAPLRRCHFVFPQK